MGEQIIARRITLDEYLKHCAGKTEYFNGKIMVDTTELFVGVKEFAESIRRTDLVRRTGNRDAKRVAGIRSESPTLFFDVSSPTENG